MAVARTRSSKEFRKLSGQTIVAYVRMASTVVIAVVVRLCLDCIGIILTGQEPAEANFWFAHCRKDGLCVLAGIFIFLTSLVLCSIFAWSCQEWITDPSKNPYADRYSFAIIVEASTWIPISVAVGKTNAIVELMMNIATDDFAQALLSSALAALLTIACALLTHVAMRRCNDVQSHAETKEAGMAGFGKFFLLTLLYSLGWAVAWSNWELVLSVMDVLKPLALLPWMHGALFSAAVVLVFLVFSTCFYLKFGPEPIIPDPQLQQVCYNLGYSSSLRRSLMSYVVYSAVVCIVMCWCDPTYGLLMSLAQVVYTSSFTMFDAGAFLVLGSVATVVTILAAIGSATITWGMGVDACSSMKLSRSVHRACQQMVKSRRSNFDRILTQVLEDGSDARLATGDMEELPIGRTMSLSLPPDIYEADSPPNSAEEYQFGGDHPSARCRYLDLDMAPGIDEQEDIASERQLRLNRVHISSALCLSVLAFDVLGLVVCFQWGALALRFYSVVFGRLASVHDALYMLSCLLYAAAVVLAVSRFVFSYFPSSEEQSSTPKMTSARSIELNGDEESFPLKGVNVGYVAQMADG